MRLNADAIVYAAILEPGETARLELQPGRSAWVHVARGSVRLSAGAARGGDGAGELQELHEGDGAALTDEAEVRLEGVSGEVLVFDLA